MGIYPKYRKPTGTKVCPECGDVVKARGLSSHMRLKHPVITYVTKVIYTGNTVIDVGNNTSKDISNTVITQAEGKDLTECVRPDGKHFYTETDLKILHARWYYSVKSEVALFNQFDMMDLIADFERRFECTFREIKDANKDLIEDMKARGVDKAYLNMEYSR